MAYKHDLYGKTVSPDMLGEDVPVLAQIAGLATAVECHLTASCDLAGASDQAKFAVLGVNIGLFCSTLRIIYIYIYIYIYIALS